MERQTRLELAITRLEIWNSTIELLPQTHLNHQLTQASLQLPNDIRISYRVAPTKKINTIFNRQNSIHHNIFLLSLRSIPTTIFAISEDISLIFITEIKCMFIFFTLHQISILQKKTQHSKILHIKIMVFSNSAPHDWLLPFTIV